MDEALGGSHRITLGRADNRCASELSNEEQCAMEVRNKEHVQDTRVHDRLMKCILWICCC